MEIRAESGGSKTGEPQKRGSILRLPRPERSGVEFCEYVKGIMDTVFDFLLVLDADLRVVAGSHSFYRAFNLRREDTEGRALYEVGNRRFDVPALRGLLRDILETEGELQRLEVENDFALAEGRIVRAAASRLPGRIGKSGVILLAFENITDLVRTKQQLREEMNGRKWTDEELLEYEQRYRMLVETMNDGLAVRDEHGVLTYVNNRLCDMLGYTRDEMIGHPVTDFLDEANQGTYKEQVAWRELGEKASYDLTWKHKDGRQVDTIMSPKPVFSAAEHFRGSFAVITDISDRRAAEAALRCSERKIRQVSSYLLNSRERERERISRELHDELGQDLAVLKYQARFIQSRLRKDQQALKEAGADAMQHLDAIMDSVRAIARDLSPSILKNLGLMASLRKLVEDFARHSEIQVSSELEDIDHCLSEEAEVNLYRIIQEAFTNVSKHAGATRMTISVMKTNDGIFVRITDDGKGFDMASVTGAHPEPTGLGLAIMEERARMIMGSFEIRSAQGAGTEIVLWVPVQYQTEDIDGSLQHCPCRRSSDDPAGHQEDHRRASGDESHRGGGRWDRAPETPEEVDSRYGDSGHFHAEPPGDRGHP